MPRRITEQETQDRLTRQQRQQTGAALLLGAIVLIAIVVRAAWQGVLPLHWWRPW